MERARIIVRGDVRMVGFRGFVIKQMKSLKLKGGADNLPDGTVEVLCEGEKDRINELIVGIKETPLHFARVDSVEPGWQEYVGDLKEPEREGEDVPKNGATLDDLLVVMKSFDNKAEILNERVGDVASNTGGIISNTGDMATTLREFRKESGEKQDQMLGKQDQMLGKQDQMLGKQDQMLDKQDETIESINKGFTETKQDFTTLRDDYGKISQTMEKILDRLTQQQKEFTEAINGLTNAILKLAEKSAE